MKIAAHAPGVNIPGYVLARDDRDLDQALAQLHSPMIVKHPSSHSSVGLTPRSRETDAASLAHILHAARRREAHLQRRWEHRYSHERGFEPVAREAIPARAVAVRYEERPVRIVSRGAVELRWQGRRRACFDRYAWPLSDRVFALWSDDPEE